MASIAIGQKIHGQFRADAFIASGGMGAVYRVWDLQRNVPLAMKVLHADLAEDPALLSSFRREARALSKLAHPNIVPFYGLYEEAGSYFLLERFIEGQTLKDILRERAGQPLTAAEMLPYLKALCSALGYAHANGLVHCDVKPGNVIVEKSGTIYLTDFGVARHAESTTTTFAGAGTPAYMAPEQIRSEAVTAETDIYSLGVLLYELLTGQRPFRGEGTGSASGGTAGERIRQAHLKQAAADPRSVNAQVGEEMARVILVCLAKEGEQRWANTEELFRRACAAAGVRPDAVPAQTTPLQMAETHWPAQNESPAANNAAGLPPKLAPTRAKGLLPALVVGALLIIALTGYIAVQGKNSQNGPGSSQANRSSATVAEIALPPAQSTPAPGEDAQQKQLAEQLQATGTAIALQQTRMRLTMDAPSSTPFPTEAPTVTEAPTAMPPTAAPAPTNPPSSANQWGSISDVSFSTHDVYCSQHDALTITVSMTRVDSITFYYRLQHMVTNAVLSGDDWLIIVHLTRNSDNTARAATLTSGVDFPCPPAHAYMVWQIVADDGSYRTGRQDKPIINIYP
jgi:hypothetical protein